MTCGNGFKSRPSKQEIVKPQEVEVKDYQSSVLNTDFGKNSFPHKDGAYYQYSYSLPFPEFSFNSGK